MQNVSFVFIFDSFNPSRPDPGEREKINLNFYFMLVYGAPKGFMKRSS